MSGNKGICQDGFPNAKQSESSGPAFHFMVDFLAGGSAAAVSKTAAAPIERVKLLIQNQGAMITAGRLTHPYRGITDCFIRTYREEGLGSFWRGNGTNVIRYFPTQAINFAAKDAYKRMFSFRKSEGFFIWVAVQGLDCQLTGSLRHKEGVNTVYGQTLRTDGVAGLYRGFVPSLVGICVYRGLYFGGYDTVKDTLLQGNLKGNFAASFAVGYFCTTAAALAAYPLDTIRRRMMMTSGEAVRVRYKSFIDAGRRIVAKEGVKALFGGAGANILRGVAGAGVLAIYDKFQELAWGKAYSVGSR